MAGTGFGGLFGAQSNSDINIGTNLVLYGGVLGLLAPVLLILSLIAAFALRAEKGWGRIMGIITAVLSIFDFPIGTAFGIYWLFAFFGKS